ncbi:MAG: thioredoxin family protein, partial [Gammaproteobacteria bacterium]
FGVGSAAVMSNGRTDYPEDLLENMARVPRARAFTFPYLFDETQKIAKSYGAVATPDFFGYNKEMKLQYRGRFDDGGMSPKLDARRELYEAMRQIAETGRGPEEQTPSVGCSIKWSRR